MIAHQQFFSMRLTDYLAPESVEEFDSWRFLGREWRGEAFGATEFLRPRELPEQTHLINLDLQELPAARIRELMLRLGLPLMPGMMEQQVIEQLGPPAKVHDFLPYRKTLDYQVFQPDPYLVSVTLRNDLGLTNVLLLVEELKE